MQIKIKGFMGGILFTLGVILVLGLIISSKGKQTNLSPTNQPKTEFIISSIDHVRGGVNAPVTIVEFSDFECPYCAAFHNNMKQLWQKYPHKIRWVYKQFPLDSIHANARSAAEASECAAEQGKFWEFADRLVEQRQSLNSGTYEMIARSLFLDMERFSACVASRKYQDKVNGDLQLGVESGAKGTPTSFFNGYMIPGVIPFDKLEQIVNNVK